MKTPRWKMWQGVYKGSGDPVFKIPLSGELFHMPQFVSRKQNVTGIYRKYEKL